MTDYTPPLAPNSNAIVVFDLDGTLVDSAKDIVPTLNTLIGKRGLAPLADDKVGYLVGKGARKMIERAYEVNKRKLTQEELEPLFNEFVEIYRTRLTQYTTAFEGAFETCHALKKAGWKIAICTNKTEDLALQLLKHMDMVAPFDAICGANTFPERKPDPAHIIKTIAQAGGDPKNAIMVGDSISDIEAARRASIPSIAVTFGYTDIPVEELKPTKIIKHYSEFSTALSAIINT